MLYMNLVDPQIKDLEGAASAYLLFKVARSGVPLERWALQTCSENRHETASEYRTPRMPINTARLLLEYLESNFDITSIDIQTDDDTALILSTDSSVNPSAYGDTARWYLDWHASTSLIDDTIREFVIELLKISENESNIYRGEPKNYYNISSTIYRHYRIDDAAFIEKATKALLRVARRYESIQDDLELQALIQHYGGRSNLIDFSTSIWIALFFACFEISERENAGYLFVLDTSSCGDFQILRESEIATVDNRMSIQKSVFLSPPSGVLDPAHLKTSIKISSELKWSLLDYLREVHHKYTESIFPDIHGFIREQDEYLSSDVLMEAGNALMRQKCYQDSIQYFEQVLLLHPTGFFAGQAEAAKAIALMKLNRDDDAIASADRALVHLKTGTSNPRGTAHLAKALVYLGQGRIAKARSEIIKAVNNFSGGAPDLTLAKTILYCLENPEKL